MVTVYVLKDKHQAAIQFRRLNDAFVCGLRSTCGKAFSAAAFGIIHYTYTRLYVLLTRFNFQLFRDQI